METQQIQQLLLEHHQYFILGGSLIFGETVVITAALLSVAVGISLMDVFVYSFIGTGISDTAWFMIGRYFRNSLFENKTFRNKFLKVKNYISDLVKNPRLALLYYKFLYGLRVLMILHIASTKTSTRSFLIFNTFGLIIWLTAIVGTGWLAGQGIVNLVPFLGSVQYCALGLIVFFITRRFVKKWIHKETIKA